MKKIIILTLSENFNEIENMELATASNKIQELSLKSHFMPIWELALLIQSFDNFSKKCCLLFKSAIPWPELGQYDGFVE